MPASSNWSVLARRTDDMPIASDHARGSEPMDMLCTGPPHRCFRRGCSVAGCLRRRRAGSQDESGLPLGRSSRSRASTRRPPRSPARPASRRQPDSRPTVRSRSRIALGPHSGVVPVRRCSAPGSAASTIHERADTIRERAFMPSHARPVELDLQTSGSGRQLKSAVAGRPAFLSSELQAWRASWVPRRSAGHMLRRLRTCPRALSA